jgi:hypothetical protein
MARKRRKFAVVHGRRGYRRRGYYRKAFTIVRKGKRIRIPATRVKATRVPPTRKKWKMRIWHLRR